MGWDYASRWIRGSRVFTIVWLTVKASVGKSSRPCHWRRRRTGRSRRRRPRTRGGDDAEVGPGAAYGPEQLGVLRVTGPDQRAVGRHHVDRAHVAAQPSENSSAA